MMCGILMDSSVVCCLQAWGPPSSLLGGEYCAEVKLSCHDIEVVTAHALILTLPPVNGT